MSDDIRAADPAFVRSGRDHERRAWRIVLLALVAALALLGVILFARPDPILRPHTQAAVDSLRVSRPAFDSARAALVRAETVYVERVRTIVTTASVDRARADASAIVADSLATLAARALSALDSAALWLGAYTERTAEARQLRAEADTLRGALAVLDSARLVADVRATVEGERRQRTEAVLDSVLVDVGHAGRCRVLRFVPCPTRKQAAGVGAVLGAVTVAVLRR